MTVKLHINEVRTGSFDSKKSGTIHTLDFICIDKDDGQRLSHSVVFSVDKSQKEAVSGLSVRDKVLEAHVTEVKLSLQGEVIFKGRITNLEALAASAAPLRVEKPAKVA